MDLEAQLQILFVQWCNVMADEAQLRSLLMAVYILWAGNSVYKYSDGSHFLHLTILRNYTATPNSFHILFFTTNVLSLESHIYQVFEEITLSRLGLMKKIFISIN